MKKRALKFIGLFVVTIVFLLGFNIWNDIKVNNLKNAMSESAESAEDVAKQMALAANENLEESTNELHVYPVETQGARLIYRYKFLDIDKSKDDYNIEGIKNTIFQEVCVDENKTFFKIGGSAHFSFEDKNNAVLSKELINTDSCNSYERNKSAVDEAG